MLTVSLFDQLRSDGGVGGLCLLSSTVVGLPVRDSLTFGLMRD